MLLTLYGIAMILAMHTVIETATYLAAAEDAGMTPGDRERAVLTLSADPTAGDLMVGTGGCRKLRLSGRGQGKSGGYRLITYFHGRRGEVFLLTVFSKGQRANLSQAERNALASIVKKL